MSNNLDEINKALDESIKNTVAGNDYLNKPSLRDVKNDTELNIAMAMIIDKDLRLRLTNQDSSTLTQIINQFIDNMLTYYGSKHEGYEDFPSIFKDLTLAKEYWITFKAEGYLGILRKIISESQEPKNIKTALQQYLIDINFK